MDDFLHSSASILSDRAAEDILNAHTLPSRSRTADNIFSFSKLLSDARTAVGDRPVFDHNDNVRAVHRRPSAARADLSITKMGLPPVSQSPFSIIQSNYLPSGTSSGQVSTIRAALVGGASRTIAAGAHLVEIPADAEQIKAINGEMITFKKHTTFSTIEPAAFELIENGELTGASAPAIYRAKVDNLDMPSIGYQVSLSRKEQKQYDQAGLEDAVLASIIMGLGRAIDDVLLTAITALTPSPFTLAKAAAAGLDFAELAAFVGTSGTGASVSADGHLRAGGIAATLTPTIATTVVGAFNRAAVAVGDEVRVIADRTNVQGDLTLTCWADAQALIPLETMFWSVAP